MKNADIIDLYKKGYSIDYIIDKFYKDKRKNIVNKNDLKKDIVRKEVEEVILSL